MTLTLGLGRGLRRPAAAGGLVVDLAGAGTAEPALVGATARRLASLRAAIGLPVPDGLVITSTGCRAILTERACPPGVADAILAAFDALVTRAGGGDRTVWVRPVTAGAGEAPGDAGRAGIPNVGRDDLLETCRAALAGPGAPRPPGVAAGPADQAALCVLLMVDAHASGVLRTGPGHDAGPMTIHGTWGFAFAPGGPAARDEFRVARNERHDIVHARIVAKGRMCLARKARGLIEVDVPGWMQRQPCLTRDQIARLAAVGERVEQREGGPRNIEWAVDASEKIRVVGLDPGRAGATGARA